MTRGQWQKVIDVNLTGQFLCAREAVREFKRHGVRPEISCAAGKIICISSVHEVIPCFIEAWLRIRANTDQAKAEARKRFLDPFRDHLLDAGLGHISEIADAEAPHTPRGCPFQAWSIGELIRLDSTLLR